MYDDYKALGPYNRPDGRMHMVLIHKETKKMTTVSYPKYRMECLLNKYLEKDEEVHHINGVVYDNRDENFAIVKKGEHQRSHILGTSKYIPEIFTCIKCGKKWLATSSQVKERQRNEKKGKTGPYCSPSCRRYASC